MESLVMDQTANLRQAQREVLLIPVYQIIKQEMDRYVFPLLE